MNKNEIEVAFFNVGDGACTVLKHHTHNVWVVDAGSRKNPFQSMDYKGTKIDTSRVINAIINWIRISPKGNANEDPKSINLVITHHDYDHYKFMGEISHACKHTTSKRLFTSFFDSGKYTVKDLKIEKEKRKKTRAEKKKKEIQETTQTETRKRGRPKKNTPPPEESKTENIIEEENESTNQDGEEKEKMKGIYDQFDLVKIHGASKDGKTFNWDGSKMGTTSPAIEFLGSYGSAPGKDNDNSLIIKFSYGSHSVLLTGDATQNTIDSKKKKTASIRKS